MPSQTEIRERITQQILDALKNGDQPPWRQPWWNDLNAGMPRNVVSQKISFIGEIQNCVFPRHNHPANVTARLNF